MGGTAWTDRVEQVAQAIARNAVDDAAKTACNAMTIRMVGVTVRTWSVRRARRQTRPSRR